MKPRYWQRTNIIVECIDGALYALNGWNGEKWMHCWKCIDNTTAKDEDCAYEVRPVYGWDHWNEEDGEFQDSDGNPVDGIIGYEVL